MGFARVSWLSGAQGYSSWWDAFLTLQTAAQSEPNFASELPPLEQACLSWQTYRRWLKAERIINRALRWHNTAYILSPALLKNTLRCYS